MRHTLRYGALLLLGTLWLAGGPGVEARTISGNDYMSFRQLASDVAPMVVSVQVRWAQLNRAYDGSTYETYIAGDTGSGFVYDNRGHVVTSYSNLARKASSFAAARRNRATEPDHMADYIKVVFQDRASYEAKIVGFDKELDIAVLRLVNHFRRRLEPLPLALDREQTLGQPVLTVAYNFITRDRINVSFGVVSAQRSQFPSLEDAANEFIQVAFPKNAGYDGGPIVDLEGHVVAMITSVAPYTEVDEVHFGVPSRLLHDRVEEIIEHGKVRRKWFGFNLIALNESIRLSYDIPDEITGMFVVNVDADSPAAAAGLRAGDILFEFNGITIDALDKLRNELERLKVGDTTTLVYLRRDFNVFDRYSMDFTLQERPPADTTTKARRLPLQLPGTGPRY